jgi:hypothetical protein
MDSQGGGVAVLEALADPDPPRAGERPLCRSSTPRTPRTTDDLAGRPHRRNRPVRQGRLGPGGQPRDAKDFEDKALLFPEFDPAVVGRRHRGGQGRRPGEGEDRGGVRREALRHPRRLRHGNRGAQGRAGHHRPHPDGTSLRDRWDTPEVKLAGGKKGRLRKDRYSALLMANMVGRTLQRAPKQPEYEARGGFARPTRRAGGPRGRPAPSTSARTGSRPGRPLRRLRGFGRPAGDAVYLRWDRSPTVRPEPPKSAQTEPLPSPPQQPCSSPGRNDEAAGPRPPPGRARPWRAEPVVRTQGSDAFLNIGPGQRLRPGRLRPLDYDYFRRTRRSRQAPGRHPGCMQAYEHVGIIRNVIDLMADFACQGVASSTPTSGSRSSTRSGSAGSAARTAPSASSTCSTGRQRRLSGGHGQAAGAPRRRCGGPGGRRPPSTDGPSPAHPAAPRIPWQYTFLNPLNALEVMATSWPPSSGRTPSSTRSRFPTDPRQEDPQGPQDGRERKLVAQLPKDIRQAIQARATSSSSTGTRPAVFYYKRDDWEVWAPPCLGHPARTSMLKKMKLADLAALDGAISSIRVWKLGSLEHKILPTESGHSPPRRDALQQRRRRRHGPRLGPRASSWSRRRPTSTSSSAPPSTSRSSRPSTQGLGIPPTLTGPRPPRAASPTTSSPSRP